MQKPKHSRMMIDDRPEARPSASPMLVAALGVEHGGLNKKEMV